MRSWPSLPAHGSAESRFFWVWVYVAAVPAIVDDLIPAVRHLRDTLARKAEQYSLEDLERQASLYREESLRLGVRRLDGELPREQLCAEIGLEVWRALRKSK